MLGPAPNPVAQPPVPRPAVALGQCSCRTPQSGPETSVRPVDYRLEIHFGPDRRQMPGIPPAAQTHRSQRNLVKWAFSITSRVA